MEELKLSNGLIAIGYGGTSSIIDQTNFSLSLANKLAENENVLFLNWNNYPLKLKKLITKLENKKNEKLELNTSIAYFGLASFLDITKLIEKHKYSTIFIDNAFSYISEEFKISESVNRDLLIKSLKHIVDRYSVRVVFNISIDPEMFSYSYYEHENEIDLGYFRWSRKIITDCKQVIAVQNIESSVNGETDEYYGKNMFKVFDLKNESDEIEKRIINLKK